MKRSARQLLRTGSRAPAHSRAWAADAGGSGRSPHSSPVAAGVRRPRHILATLIGWAALWHPCAACPPSNHGCFEEGGAGCTDQECCDAVCEVNDLCCAVLWDHNCVQDALAMCALGCPLECPPEAIAEGESCGAHANDGCSGSSAGTSSCCFPTGRVGCGDPECVAIVCAVDSFCCTVAWDQLCADEAIKECPWICGPFRPSLTPVACGATICGTLSVDGFDVDSDWYQLDLAAPTQVVVTLSTTYPATIGVAETDGVPDCELADEMDPFAVASACGTATSRSASRPGRSGSSWRRSSTRPPQPAAPPPPSTICSR